MIDHVSLSVEDITKAKHFYTKALAPLGLGLVGEYSAEESGDVAAAGFGIGRKGSFWLLESGQQSPPSHVCFRASSHEAVRQFYQAGLDAGGMDNGPPGPRELYHPAYYAAFIHSPEGHNIEAVCFEDGA
ncbi:MAG: VOC family protein [Planctomycetota bacterium]|nr:VOC family protein [Planctomycetota bacterium]